MDGHVIYDPALPPVPTAAEIANKKKKSAPPQRHSKRGTRAPVNGDLA
jgi:hypothetical protein